MFHGNSQHNFTRQMTRACCCNKFTKSSFRPIVPILATNIRKKIIITNFFSKKEQNDEKIVTFGKKTHHFLFLTTSCHSNVRRTSPNSAHKTNSSVVSCCFVFVIIFGRAQRPAPTTSVRKTQWSSVKDVAGVCFCFLVVVDAHEEEVIGILRHFCGILLA